VASRSGRFRPDVARVGLDDLELRQPGARRAGGPGAGERGADEPGAGERGASERREGQLEPGRGRGGHRAPRRAAAADPGLFTQVVLDYAAHQPERAIHVLQAGCVTARGDLDIAALRASRYTVTLTLVDDDHEVTRSAVADRVELRAATLGDLRTVPLVSRSADIVHCAGLLDRISHAELVLGRLADAVKPGGLLLLRLTDRQTAAALLDRALPGPLRAAAWRSLRPGEPGPYPAIYEQLACARGIQSFAARRDLVISQRELSCRMGGKRRPFLGPSRALVAAASRGRLSARHDELRYVIRKPEDRFARVL
jgi:SAM-dependent methyltransferase